jgi:hypothetical protein
MDSLLICGVGASLLIAAGVVTLGVLALAGAALTKYLFYGDHNTAAV